MRLIPSDPDVQTLVLRIENGDIDLQPDFQRGEIWSIPKRQKLIDSILRSWHVPPLHVILEETEQRTSVLDGQQRLAAIRDFVRDRISVDGFIRPTDVALERLDGLRFSELPPDVRRKFLQFPLRLFTITDYEVAEPSELFYRLNQPTSLTAAEQRNAFFGVARRQVKSLVEDAEDAGLSSGLFGFSNARMAYDDVIAKVLYLLDAGTLREKITSSALADKYRSGEPFNEDSVVLMRGALKALGEVRYQVQPNAKLNKATAQSWLTFLAVCGFYAPNFLRENAAAEFFLLFEEARHLAIKADKERQSNIFSVRLGREFATNALYAYESRSTARVADVSSVVIRDLTIWLFFLVFAEERHLDLPAMSLEKTKLKAFVKKASSVQYASLEWLADDLDWGTRL